MTPYQRLKMQRERLKAEGRCINCREYRGADGTTTRCRKCADKCNGATTIKPVANLLVCLDDIDSLVTK